MPKVYLTFEERNKAKFISERNRQVKALAGELALTKHSVPIREIEKKVDFSRAVIVKVRNNPLEATLEQLFDVCYAAGKKVVISIE